jgi:di/tripeptidase
LRRYPGHRLYLHVDTSPDFSGKNVNPQIVENYRGGDIALGIGDEVLSPVMFPVLHQLLGQTLITTDGKTLLGADDKAGIAEIMTALATLKGKNIPHGDIRVAFTPDEEVGKARSILMSTPLTPAGPIPSTAAAWASWSLKTSTPRR